MGRRENGTGTYKRRSWERKDGTKATVWRYSVPFGGKVYEGSGDTKKAAEAAARAKIAKAMTATPPVKAESPAEPAPVRTFGAWLFEYNAHKRKQGRADNTVQRYAELARTWSDLNPDGKGKMGERPLDTVGIMELELCIAELGKAVSQNTLRTAKGYLSGCLQRAYLLRYVERNEARLLDPIGFKQKRKLNINEDGFASLCRAAKGDPIMLSALILGRFGLRISEACGVTSDDLTGNVLSLSRQLGRVTTEGEHGPQDAPRAKDARTPRGRTTVALCELKTENAARTVLLSDLEASLLMNALDSSKPDVLWDAVAREWRTVLFVCHGRGGKSQDDNKLRDRFNDLAAEAGLSGLDFHDLRALCATALADAGIPTKAISDCLGHSSVSVTELYLRGLRRSQSAAWSVTSDAIASALAA